MDLVQAQGTSVIFLGAVALTTAILLFRAQRYFGNRRSDQSYIVRSPRSAAEDRRPSLDAPPEKQRWEVQMHETARELMATLDTKMRALGHLVREANQVIVRLENLLDGARSEPNPQDAGVPAVDRTEAREGHQTAVADPRPTQAEGLRLTEVIPPPAPSAKAALAFRVSAAESPAEQPKSDGRYADLYALADTGCDAAEISRRLGTPVGEVELILGLRDAQ
jgi:hypothetical protein